MSTNLTFSPAMVSDVLSRLPVKSLLRFRSISKPVCSIIDAPDFANLHLKNSTNNNNKCLLLCHCPLSSVNLPSLKRAVKIDHPLKTPEPNTELLGSCNGLVCLYNSVDEIAIWNMSTRKHHVVPYLPIVFPNPFERRTHRFGYGFGYDSVHDDYKLVRIVQFRLGSEVMVYSMKSDSWKRVDGGFCYDFLYQHSVGLFTDEALHWLIDHPVAATSLILAFDLANEEFREVLHPTLGRWCKNRAFEQFGVLEGHICVIHIYTGIRTDIWVLKHYGVDEPWVKLVSTSLPQLTVASRCVMPLSYLKNGKELLLLHDMNKLICYDLKTNKVKNIRVRGLPPAFDALTYVESLVKPLPMVIRDRATTTAPGTRKKPDAKSGGFILKGITLLP